MQIPSSVKDAFWQRRSWHTCRRGKTWRVRDKASGDLALWSRGGKSRRHTCHVFFPPMNPASSFHWFISSLKNCAKIQVIGTKYWGGLLLTEPGCSTSALVLCQLIHCLAHAMYWFTEYYQVIASAKYRNVKVNIEWKRLHFECSDHLSSVVRQTEGKHLWSISFSLICQ